MANMQGQFPGIQFQKIVGYRISARWVPKQGFERNFFAYIWDEMDAATPFPDKVDVGSNDAPRRGSLNLKDDSRVYSFDNINIESIQEGATRRNRYRLYEFRYDPAYLTNGSTPVSLTNNDTVRLIKGATADDYQYSLGDDKEYLLGFRQRRGAGAQGNVTRFSALRNNANCFLQKVITSNNENNSSSRMSDYTINFTQGSVTVQQDNLGSVYVQESYGYLESSHLPPLADYLTAGDQYAEANTRLRMNDFSQADLLDLDANMNPAQLSVRPRTVETATYVFEQGAYQNLQVS
jgi:hypothetical protein